MTSNKIELTGNPFVDTGLGVIASLTNDLDDINELTLTHLKSVYADGELLIRWNSSLKSFTQIFGTNNPLFQPSYGFKKGKGPSDINRAIYKSIIEALLSEIEVSTNGLRCWSCGNHTGFNFSEICKKAVESNGKKASDDKYVGRDWFPLAGSLGSDAQALPSASLPPTICPKCLYAIHYMPIGLILIDGKLTVFQSTSIDFWYEFLHNIVNYNISRIQAGDYETLGKKDGNNVLLRRLLEYFRSLNKEVPKGTELYMWRFSNSGTSPECQIETIPNSALVFLNNAKNENLIDEIYSLIMFEKKNSPNSIYRCILEGRDYPNLYPDAKRKGASSKLFVLYQTSICHHSLKALHIAHKLAKEISEQVDEKEMKRIQRFEAFKELKVRNQFRVSMVLLTEKGELTLEEYYDLFPIQDQNGISVAWDGWNLIRFFLYHSTEDFPKMEEKQDVRNKTHPELYYYAGHIYNHYLSEKGRDRFQKEVLTQMSRGIGVSWLRNQFVQLAELYDGFNYGQWSKLCKLENGNVSVWELLFQMRLLWSQWIYENKTILNFPALNDVESKDGLPDRIKTSVEAIFMDYMENRGIDRFYRDILLRLRRGDMGLTWFKKRLTDKISDKLEPVALDEWEEFLVDIEGKSIKSERLFQLHLILANNYRLNNKKVI